MCTGINNLTELLAREKQWRQALLVRKHTLFLKLHANYKLLGLYNKTRLFQ